MKEEVYTVEFLIRKVKVVKALNDIQAEILAAATLSAKDQEAVEKVRVDGVYDWCTPDKSCWDATPGEGYRAVTAATKEKRMKGGAKT